jgi:Cytochrome C assembly protein.
MLKLSQYSLIAALMLVVLALGCYILALTLARSVRKTPVLEHAGVGARTGAGSGVAETSEGEATGGPRSLALYGTYFTRLALVFLTACLVLRTIAVGHGPFSNQYEFSVSFGWGMIAAYVYFEHRYHVRTIALLILPLTTGLLLYAMSVGATANPLVPALQNNLLLTIHVAVAIIAYGAFAVSFAAAVLYLIQPEGGRPGLPKPALLDEIGYRASSSARC